MSSPYLDANERMRTPKKPPKKKFGLDIGAPPPLKTPEKAPPSQAAALKAISEKYPGPKGSLKARLPLIIAAANRWDADPVELYALILMESGGSPDAVSSAGAAGLTQVWDATVDKTLNPSRYDEFVREFGKEARSQGHNPVFAINYAAWRMGGTRKFYASFDEWYTGNDPRGRGYNPGFDGQGPSTFITETSPDYQAKLPTTVPERVAEGKSASDTRTELVDPFVAGVGKSGKVVTTRDASKAFVYDGIPLRLSEFGAAKRHYEDIFISYTGGRPSNKQVLTVLKNGWGDYTLIANVLSKSKKFVSSPIYKKRALFYQAAARDLLPKGGKLDADLLRTAIVNDWEASALQEALRQRGAYEKSEEYRNNRSVLDASYRRIMGMPDPQGDKVINHAAKLGWTQGNFESWLRSTPSYQFSPEYQAKSLSFLDAMGLFIGARPTLTEVPKVKMASVPQAKLGQGSIAPPIDMMPTGQLGRVQFPKPAQRKPKAQPKIPLEKSTFQSKNKRLYG